MGPAECAAAKQRLRKLGLHSIWAPASRTDKDHARAWSAGVGAVFHSWLNTKEVAQGTGALQGRWLLLDLQLKSVTLPIMVGYGFATSTVDAQNAAWLAAMGQAIHIRNLPALIFCDWNFEPGQLFQTG